MNHAARHWHGPVVLGCLPLVVLASVTVGLRGGFGPFAGPQLRGASVDYSRGPAGEYRRLRPAFVEAPFGADAVGFLPAVSGRPVAWETLAHSAGGDRALGDRALGDRALVVSHPLINDALKDAFVVPSVPFTARTNSARATREPRDPSSCAPTGGTIWYRYTPPVGAALLANTFGTDHAVSLGVFTGSADDLRALGCATSPAGDAQVAFAVSPGTAYWFQVTAPLGGGQSVFTLTPQGRTSRVSVAPQGGAPEINAVSLLSGDGRYVVFTSAAEDPRGSQCGQAATQRPCNVQVYLYDRTTLSAALVSASSAGEPGNDFSVATGISEDGRFVTFSSAASNLVAGDTNTCGAYTVPGSCPDVFVHDRLTGTTTRMSVDSQGRQAQGGLSWLGWISGDGRYVAFESDAPNLVPGDTNGVRDIFVHDRDADGNGVFDETGPGDRRTVRVSVSSGGDQANDATSAGLPYGERGSNLYSISHNGRYVMFRSAASNLVHADHNARFDVFVHDLVRRTTTRVSVSSSGQEANGDSLFPVGTSQWSVSDDGRLAIFNSSATNLVAGDTNGQEDLFVRDLAAGTTERVSVTSQGGQAQGEESVGQDPAAGPAFLVADAAFFGVVSNTELNYSGTPDGRYVFFSSGANNLVPEDSNEARDVFVRDLRRATTTRVSVATSGREADGSSNLPSASADGRVVAFQSLATNLVDGEASQAGPALSPGVFVREQP